MPITVANPWSMLVTLVESYRLKVTGNCQIPLLRGGSPTKYDRGVLLRQLVARAPQALTLMSAAPACAVFEVREVAFLLLLVLFGYSTQLGVNDFMHNHR